MTAVTTNKKQTPAPATPSSMPSSHARHPLSTLRQEFDDLMSRFWDGDRTSWFNAPFAPSVDLMEEANAFEVRMDLPGMEAKDIQIQVEGNVMTVSGKREEEREEKEKTYHRVERRYGSFSRSIALPVQVNPDEVAADYTHGVLTVKLPKSEKAAARKISVKG
jgi:HSP20 family protein